MAQQLRGITVSKGSDDDKKKRSGNYRECIICANVRPLGRHDSNFPWFPNCTHEPRTCSNCVVTHLAILLKARAMVTFDATKLQNVVTWAGCTCAECNAPLSETDVRSILPRRQIAELDDVANNKLLEAHPRWVWCSSPNCDSGQIFSTAESSTREKFSQRVTCVRCGAHTCFHHRIPWHQGYTCTMYDNSHPNSEILRSSEEHIKKISKRCPTKGCGWRIQKAGGCPNMMCELLFSFSSSSHPNSHMTFLRAYSK